MPTLEEIQAQCSYVSIHLPGTVKFNSDQYLTPVIKHHMLQFSRGEYFIEVCPKVGLFERATISPKYSDLIKATVNTQISHIADLLPTTLCRLHKEKKAPGKLDYETIYHDLVPTVKIYEDASTSTMTKLAKIRSTPTQLLREDYRDLKSGVARYVEVQDDQYYVEGAGLRLALEKAIEIYQMAERLRAIELE